MFKSERLSMRRNVYIIAEAGVNHNGSITLAKRLVDAAVSAGADAVKFQTFSAEKLVSENAELADYQKKNIGNFLSQREMLKRLELSENNHQELLAYCREKGIQFCSTAFDIESVRYLASLDLPFMKCPSGELTNLPFLRELDLCGKPVILSTGMATMKEVEEAISVFSQSALTLLHCTTEYPCPYDEVNLKAMEVMHKRFGFPVGYSDHTIGIEVPIAAVAMGASVIEKHLTIDRKMNGPDHSSSLEPNEFQDMVCSIRKIERALGTGEKKPSLSEQKNISVVRKSIVARGLIKKGDMFSVSNLTTCRPGDGLSPMVWDDLIGTVSDRDYQAGEPIMKC